MKCVSWLSLEELRRRKVEEETDDHATRITRRTTQRLPICAGSTGRKRDHQAVDQGDDRTWLASGDGRAFGLPQACTRSAPESANTRHGAGQKTLKSAHGELEISVPRDRDGSVAPMLVKKRQTRLDGFEEKTLALYARGMTTRDMAAQLRELYGVEVSPTFLSHVTEEVMEEVRHWQKRPLEPLYPIL